MKMPNQSLHPTKKLRFLAGEFYRWISKQWTRMETNVLDLDTPSTWNNRLRQTVYAESTLAALLADLDGQGAMYQELHEPPGNVTDPFIKNLRERCEEALRTDYTHAAAYHACRSADPNEYRRHGILTSSRKRLETQARELFVDIEGLEDALATCDSYFGMYDGSVSLYTTAKFAPTCYLSGSHYLSMVTNELGPEAQAILARENDRGRPVFVKCSIPLSWFDDLKIVKDPSLYLYSTSLIKKLIRMRMEGSKHYQDTPSAFVVFSSIPPQNVDSIVEADAVCIQWQRESQQRVEGDG